MQINQIIIAVNSNYVFSFLFQKSWISKLPKPNLKLQKSLLKQYERAPMTNTKSNAQSKL